MKTFKGKIDSVSEFFPTTFSTTIYGSIIFSYQNFVVTQIVAYLKTLTFLDISP